MKNNENAIESILIKIFLIVNILIYIYFFAVSFVFSWVNLNVKDEMVYMQKDNIIINAISLVVIAGLLLVAYRILKQKEIKNIKRFVYIISVVSAVLGLIWVFASRTVPKGDQEHLVLAASEINHGGNSFFQNGGYLAECPHQLGIVSVMRVLYTLFGDGNYTSFKVLSCLSLIAIIICTYRIAKALSRDNKLVELLAVTLNFIFIPMYCYTSFVYGEILSTVCMLIAFTFFIESFEQFSIWKCVGLGIFSGLSVAVKENSIIALIAMLGVLAVKLIINNKRIEITALIVAIVIGLLGQSSIMNVLYKDYKVEGTEAMPSLLWVAMGLNEDYETPGWYNLYNFAVFEKYNYDADKSAEDAKKVINSFVEEKKANPKSLVSFIVKKSASQWSGPMYQGFVMNNALEEEDSFVAKNIINNTSNWKVFDSLMNIYQILCYLGLLVWAMVRYKRNGHLEDYVILITIFGGFLFSIMWEAKTRYILPYAIMIIPYAAVGIYNSVEFINAKIQKRVKK